LAPESKYTDPILEHHDSYERLIERAVLGRLATEDAYALARLATENPIPAMQAAAEMRYGLFGPRISYSRKVFIPLTKLCRDNCGYCTFAQPPHPGERAYLTPEEVLDIASLGVQNGCKEALFTLGDNPRSGTRRRGGS
jgi:FO synthase